MNERNKESEWINENVRIIERLRTEQKEQINKTKKERVNEGINKRKKKC